MTIAATQSITLSVQRWCLWQALSAEAARVIAADAGGQRQFGADRPALAAIPALQRRRLSPLARVVFHCLQHCADPDASEPLVFSSAMGEIQRTQSLLESIAEGAPLSPAAFSLSVHNAIGGLWSQIRGVRAPVVALAPVARSPVPALLEAAGMLTESADTVIAVFAEERYPAFYAPWLNSPPGPSALALRLVPASSVDATLVRLRHCPVAPASAPDPEHNGAVLGRLLSGDVDRAQVVEGNCAWQLERG